MKRFVKSQEPAARDDTPDAPRVGFGELLWRVVWVGALVATMFTAWTPLGLFPSGIFESIGQLFTNETIDPGDTLPNPTPRPRPRIGIVAGHWGNDAGTVCSDGLTEDQVNLEIATLVKEKLAAEGFEVDLLREFDEKLNGYDALLLVSIHADSCQFIDLNATGFKVAASWANPRPEKASRLVACIHSRYQEATGLPFHAGSITNDMTSYHAFDEINPETTAVIIETGFLNLDREILTQNQTTVADGIVAGILCYIFNEDASLPSSP
ncbi:MAG: N-acetylmuramoyl-L-alanine amidase [Anaerolineae bacterium]|nr:N-acetylmuramoyl-L-alanine amidase [Anaerolineae bacterium]